MDPLLDHPSCVVLHNFPLQREFDRAWWRGRWRRRRAGGHGNRGGEGGSRRPMMVIVVVKDGVLRMIFEVVGAKMAARGQKVVSSVKKRLREVENCFGVSKMTS